MKKKYIINFTLIILTLALLALLSIGFHKDFLIKQQNNEDYIAWTKSNNIYASNTYSSQISSTFNEKLKNKQNINILILGDDYILKNNSWAKEITNWFESNYGNSTELTYINVNTKNIADGLTLLNNNSKANDFDLALISFGLYDSRNNNPVDTFAQSYTNIICNLKEKNYRSCIISIIPPAIDQNNEYVSTIKSLCSLNNINFIDPFYNSNYNSDVLFTDDSLTDKGYRYLVSCFKNLIIQKLE